MAGQDHLRDHVLNENIDMINQTDRNGTFVPYYIVSKSYPTRLTYSKDSIEPDEDIKRLIDSGQVKNADYFPGTGIQVALGRNETGISGYCGADGEYNKPYVPGIDIYRPSAFSISADEDMSYYAYDPKQVSRADLDTTILTEEQCGGCANSRTWPFVSFNLREYIEKYGSAIPKKVVVRFVQNYPMQLSHSLLSLYDYSSGYYFSANKSTPNMVATGWKDNEPSGSSFIGDFSIDGYEINMDVTEQFKAALSRVKDSPSGKYEFPRLPFVISFGSDSQSVKNVYDIDSSNKGSTGPRLDVYF